MSKDKSPSGQRIDYSIGEIESLVLKACRGNGMSWGLAEEAAKAAGWLAMNRLPGIEAFAGLLGQFDGATYEQRAPESLRMPLQTPQSSNWPLCPIVAGCCISDSQWTQVDTGALAYPLILIPFVSRASRLAQATLLVSFAKLQVLCTPSGVTFDGDPSALGSNQVDTLQVRRSDLIATPRSAGAQRANAHPAAIRRLEEFAFRTYVPESDASRLSGAGAGLTDND